ncbi:MAG: substrate-binding domain-containing protein, partial [Planctomycetota bacterium]
HCDRIAGWRDAHEEAGLDVDPNLIIRIWASLEAGIQVAKRMKSLPDSTRPTAAYVVDPMAALGMLRGLQEAGLSVPHDFSLVGFDDGELRRLSYPVMTAVCQSAIQLGEKSVELMRALIAQQSVARSSTGSGKKGSRKSAPRIEPQRVTLNTTFEVGATTAPPPTDRLRP